MPLVLCLHVAACIDSSRRFSWINELIWVWTDPKVCGHSSREVLRFRRAVRMRAGSFGCRRCTVCERRGMRTVRGMFQERCQ